MVQLKSEGKNSHLRKTVVYSTAEGMVAQVYTTLAGPGSAILTRYLVFLGAGVMDFTLYSIVGQISQITAILGTWLVKKFRDTKRVTVSTISIGKILSFAFGIIPFLVPSSVAVKVFLALFFVSVSLQAIGGNVWLSWMAGVIPARIRGRFFSRRSQFLMLAGLVSGFVFSAVVDAFSPEGGVIHSAAVRLSSKIFAPHNLIYVFAGIFFTAGAVGVIGIRILKKQPSPLQEEIPEKSPLAHIKEALTDRKFLRLLGAKMWWMLAIGIGAPFWQPFMLKGLGMSVTEVQIYTTISLIANILALRIWGEIIDRFGNRPVLSMVVLLGGLYPFIWLFVSPTNYYLVFLEAVFSGIVWSGDGLGWFNLLLKIFPRQKVQVYAALFSAVSVLGSVLTSYLSGVLFPHRGVFGLAPEQILFAVGGLARLSAFFPISKIEEHNTGTIADSVKFVLKKFHLFAG